MPTIQQLIQYLRNNGHIGKDSAITARALAKYFNISDGGVEVEMRKIIRDAIAQNELIGSNSRGFYLIDNLTELEENLDSLQQRAVDILQRRRNLWNSWNSKNPANLTSKTDFNVK